MKIKPPADPVDREIAQLMHRQIGRDQKTQREQERAEDAEDHAVLLLIAEDSHA